MFGGLILALVATTVAGTAATLAVLNREARVAKLQTDFVNKVSHDLRTPLTSIRMFVETLQLGRIQDPAKQSEALEIISEETTRLSSLINRLLDWARMESGRSSYELRREPVEPIVDAALDAFAPQRLDQRVKLRRVIPLVVGFVFVPAALMLTVGILILVYGSVARDYLFGGLILALVATTVAGTAATLAVLNREARVAKLQTDFVNKVSHVAPAIEVLVLYLVLGGQSLAEHARRVAAALRAHDLDAARRQVGRMVSRDTGALQSE